MDALRTFTRSLRSPCITIRAGPESETFTVHEAVLSTSGSASLARLVQPGWRESCDGCIDWTHTSSQTVERVLTYLYFRDYEIPYPVPRPIRSQLSETDRVVPRSKARGDNQSVTPADEDVEGTPDDGGVEAVVMNDSLPHGAINAVLESALTEIDHPEAEDPDLQTAILESCAIRPLTPLGRCVGLAPITAIRKTAGGAFEGQDFPYETFSYQQTLLAHAGVYSFAKYHLLPGLQKLALQRMIVTLRKVDCSVKYAELELADAIEFVYANVPVNGDCEEPMRKLLSQFAAANYTSLLHGSFEALFARGGDFALDLARKLSRRLSAHGVSAELGRDELESRIHALELQVQEREQTIKSLNASLSDSLDWGRGIYRKGRKR